MGNLLASESFLHLASKTYLFSSQVINNSSQPHHLDVADTLDPNLVPFFSINLHFPPAIPTAGDMRHQLPLIQLTLKLSF